jgi:hypothetical protein
MTYTQVPLPADGVELLPIKDEGILFDQPGQRLFHLNPVATCIWSCLNGDRDIGAIAEATAEIMCLSPAQARHFVLDMLKSWKRVGLLDGGLARRRLPPGGEVPDQQLPRVAADELRIPISPARQQYRFLDTSFSLGFSNPALEAWVHPVLAHLETRSESSDACRIDLVETNRDIRVIHEGHILGVCDAPHEVAPLAHGLVGLLALRRYRYLLAIHAAGLVRSNATLLLAGGSGSGKTTMAAALLAAGWGYMSDDTILLLPLTLDAVAVPYSLTIKSGPWPILTRYFPTLDRAPVHRRADNQLIRYISPAHGCFAKPRPVRWMGFPHHSTTIASSIRRLGRLEGLYRLLEHCCAIPRFLTSTDVRRIVQCSADICFFEFAIADLDDAVAQIDAMTDEGGITESRPGILISEDSREQRFGHIS